jgi:transcriptional regulator with XRE-family HTH domain
MTQTELAEILGVTDGAVSAWEIGSKEPRMGNIQAMADFFGVLKSDIIEDGFLDYKPPKMGLHPADYRLIEKKTGLSSKAIDGVLGMAIEGLTSGLPVLTLLNRILARPDFHHLMRLAVLFVQKEDTREELYTLFSDAIPSEQFKVAIDKVIESGFINILKSIRRDMEDEG